MHFGNLREMSGKTGKGRKFKKKFQMPSGKRRVQSVSGRHHDDCWRNAFDDFRKAYIAFFIISDLYWVLTKAAEVITDIERGVFKYIIPLLH